MTTIVGTTTRPPRSWLRTEATIIVEQLRDVGGFDITNHDAQVLALAEEVGEFVGAYRRWSGNARRTGTEVERNLELADVVIAGYVTAARFGIDLDDWCKVKLAHIHSRGWREDAR